MFIREARQRCPALVTVPYEFDKYSATAEDMYRTLFDFTPHVQGVSVDEAYADFTGMGEAGDLASKLRAAIKERTGGCCASIGSGPNRLIARLGTKRAKPDGHWHIAQAQAAACVAELPVSDLPVCHPPNDLHGLLYKSSWIVDLPAI
eukprot:gene28214-34934_t